MPPDRPLFSDSIPRDYDTFLGPFLFEPYATDLGRRLTGLPGRAVLETSCGTGVATEALARAAGPDRTIVATDVSEPMLAIARERRGHLANVRFERADAVELPFEDASFDAVVSQFGLMFFPDKLQALREARRVLRPGGRLLLSVWGDLPSNPFVEVAQRAIAGFFDADPPDFLYLPWSLPEPAPLRALLDEAGFARPEIDPVAHVAELPSAAGPANGLVRGNPTIDAVRERARAPVEEIVDAVTSALGDVFGHAPFRAPMHALVASGMRA